MRSESLKYVIVLDESLDCGVAANTAAHLAAQLGALAPQIAGRTVVDRCGVEHSGLPVWPNVILAADEESLRRTIEKARRRAASKGDVVLLDYPEQGYTTSNDEDYRAGVAASAESDLRYLGALIFGERNPVAKITKGRRLWRCDPISGEAESGVA